jgi:hypothetical protein
MERVLRQLYIYLDAQLFNALLKKPALFTCKTGFQLKMAVSQVEAAAGKVNKLLLKISRYEIKCMHNNSFVITVTDCVT